MNAQGVEVAERFLPYDRVGIYIPGGKAPLVSTSIMTGGFAQAAGVREIVAATPCGPDGRVNPALLYALKASGATEIVKIGGAQAIAALALGTESVKPVEKIFGPGNRFVVEAKRQLVGAVAIDLLPGPSEVMVLADETADAEFLAADLLAQGEHGPDSVVVFVTTSEALLEQVEAEVERPGRPAEPRFHHPGGAGQARLRFSGFLHPGGGGPGERLRSGASGARHAG